MSKTTVGSQDRDFAERLKKELDFYIDYSWVLEWISENFSPEDVLSEGDLREWAFNNGFEVAAE